MNDLATSPNLWGVGKFQEHADETIPRELSR